MALIYYLILGFGVLLFTYTAQRWFATKKKIRQDDTSLNKTVEFVHSIKKKILLWQYYFTGGDKKKTFTQYSHYNRVIRFFIHH